MEKMQKCTQENLQQILQSAEQRPERLKAALNIIEHSDNTEEQKIKLLKICAFICWMISILNNSCWIMSITVFISSGIITVRRSKNDDSGNCRQNQYVN